MERVMDKDGNPSLIDFIHSVMLVVAHKKAL